MRRKVLISGIVLLVALLPATGRTHPARWEDSDQTEDPAREMEIRSVLQSHMKERSTRFISFKIRTFDDFDNSRLDDLDSEHFALMIAFNLDQRRDFDRLLYVDAEPDASGGYTGMAPSQVARSSTTRTMRDGGRSCDVFSVTFESLARQKTVCA